MITVSKNVLKSKMLEYFRRVEDEGEELIVTHNQVPVLKVVPLRRAQSASDAFADLRGKLKYDGDLLEPTTDEWPEV